MSLLVRAALLGGLAYVVTRAVRNRQISLNPENSEALRIPRESDKTQDDLWSSHHQPSSAGNV